MLRRESELRGAVKLAKLNLDKFKGPISVSLSDRFNLLTYVQSLSQISRELFDLLIMHQEKIVQLEERITKQTEALEELEKKHIELNNKFKDHEPNLQWIKNYVDQEKAKERWK